MMKQLLYLLVFGLFFVCPFTLSASSQVQADPPALHYEGGEGPQIVMTYSNGQLHLHNPEAQTITYRIDWKDTNGQIVYSSGKTVPGNTTADFHPITDAFNIGISGGAQLSMYEIY